MSQLRLAASEFAALDGSDRACGGCGSEERLGFLFDYAYQPIADVATCTVYGHEALVSGPNGEGALSVLSQVNDSNKYRFDQACRVKAIKTAAQLGIQERISINFLPNAIDQPEVCIRSTLEAARAHGFSLERIVFEVTEGEHVEDGPWLAEILREYKRCGLLTAIDDVGAGYAALTLLAGFQADFGVQVIAEGIETAAERDFLSDAGIHLMQGYLFGRPVFQGVAQVDAAAWGRRLGARTRAGSASV